MGVNVQVYINPEVLCSQLSDTSTTYHANALLFFEHNAFPTSNGFLPEQPDNSGKTACSDPSVIVAMSTLDVSCLLSSIKLQ